jgi:hypothetical protein
MKIIINNKLGRILGGRNRRNFQGADFAFRVIFFNETY